MFSQQYLSRLTVFFTIITSFVFSFLVFQVWRTAREGAARVAVWYPLCVVVYAGLSGRVQVSTKKYAWSFVPSVRRSTFPLHLFTYIVGRPPRQPTSSARLEISYLIPWICDFTRSLCGGFWKHQSKGFDFNREKKYFADMLRLISDRKLLMFSEALYLLCSWQNELLPIDFECLCWTSAAVFVWSGATT